MRYHARPMLWASTVSGGRWTICFGLSTLTLALCGTLLHIGIDSLKTFGVPTNSNALWHLGFGSLSANMLVNITGKTVSATPGHTAAFILLANSPQLVFSFLYLLYNNIYTSLAQAGEWADFATDRKTLRVTAPKGLQRSTYWLHLPYKYAMPLMGASGLMHWLISQSLFLANVKRRTIPVDIADPLANTSVTCGYSVIPIIFSISVGGAMLIFVLALASSRRIDGRMPLMGSCSAIISAACHPVANEELGDGEMALLPVQWGEVQVPGRERAGAGAEEHEGEEEGHCSLSSGEVAEPVEGRLYAGLKRRDVSVKKKGECGDEYDVT